MVEDPSLAVVRQVVIESLHDDPGQERRVGEAAFDCTWRRVGRDLGHAPVGGQVVRQPVADDAMDDQAA